MRAHREKAEFRPRETINITTSKFYSSTNALLEDSVFAKYLMIISTYYPLAWETPNLWQM